MPSLRLSCSLILALSLALLGACGNKGALVKPTPTPAVVIPPAPTPATNPPAKADSAPAAKNQ